MINVLYEPFPESIRIDGKLYEIYTDFRKWLRFSDLNADKSVPETEKTMALLMLLKQRPLPVPTEKMILELLAFYHADALNYHPEQEDDEESGIIQPEIRPPVFHWCIDAACVLGDFRRFYQMDLRTADSLHWWEFLTLFSSLPKESRCQERIAYRAADLTKIRNEDEKARIREIKRAIALPYEMDDEDIGAVFGEMMQ